MAELSSVGQAAPTGNPTRDNQMFSDDFEDASVGDRNDQIRDWTVTSNAGDFQATIVNQSSPEGGSKALSVWETTGGGTAGTINWADGVSGWDDEWTLSGMFYTEELSENVPFQTHSLQLYSNPDGSETRLGVQLGFSDRTNDTVPFRITGAPIDSVESVHDPGWQEDIWYLYEIRHDGNGTYTGRLWEPGESKPAPPQARSVGQPLGSEARVAGVLINGARGVPFDIRHDNIRFQASSGPDFSQLVNQKRALINSIRDGATEPINPPHRGKTTISGLSRQQIDRQAEVFLNLLESNYSEASGERRQRLREVANRLVDAERLTLKATNEPKEPLWEMSRTAASLAISAAMGFVSSAGRLPSTGQSGLLADQIQALVGELESMKVSVLGLRTLPADERRKFETLIENQANNFAELFVEEHGEDMLNAVRSNMQTLATAGTFDEIIDVLLRALGTEAVNRFTDLVDRLATVFYFRQYHLFYAEEGTGSILVRRLAGAEPAGRCPDQTFRLLETQSADTLDGINIQINEAARLLQAREMAGAEILTDGAAERDDFVTGLTSCIDEEATKVKNTIDVLDSISKGVGFISVLLALATLLSAGFALVTAGEPISSIGTAALTKALLKATVLAAAIATAINVAAILWGTLFLDFVLLTHARGTIGVIQYEVFFQ